MSERKEKIIKRGLIFLIVILSLVVLTFTYLKVTSIGKFYKDEKNLKIPVFVYHDIVKDKSEVKYDYMQTTESKFKSQIFGLMKIGYTPISYDDLIEYSKGEKAIPQKSFLITFDDGYSGVYKYAFPIAKQYNIPMASFLINYDVALPGYYTWEEANEMNNSGIITIASHSLKHLQYDKEKPEDLLKDVNTSFEDLDSKMQKKVKNKIFTYPYGLYTKEEQELLNKNGIIQNLTDNRINTSKNLRLDGIHRMYPLNDSVFKIYLKIEYRNLRYGG